MPYPGLTRTRGSVARVVLTVVAAFVILVVLAVWVTGRFIVPRAAEAILSDVTGEKVTLDRLGVYPLTGAVHLRGLAVGDKLSLGSMDVKIALRPSAAGHPLVESVDVSGLRGKVTRRADGSLDLPIPSRAAGGEPTGGEAAGAAGAEAPSEGPPPLEVKLLQLAGGPLTFVDETVGGLETSVSDLQVKVTDFSTAPLGQSEEGGTKARFAVTAKLGPGELGSLQIEGTTDKPYGETLDAELTAEGLDIAHFSPYIPAASPVVARSGRLDVKAQVSMQGTAVDVKAAFHGYGLTLGARDPALEQALGSLVGGKGAGEEISFEIHVRGDMADPAFSLREQIAQAVVDAVKDRMLGGGPGGKVDELLDEQMKQLPQEAQDLLKGLLGK